MVATSDDHGVIHGRYDVRHRYTRIGFDALKATWVYECSVCTRLHYGWDPCSQDMQCCDGSKHPLIISHDGGDVPRGSKKVCRSKLIDVATGKIMGRQKEARL